MQKKIISFLVALLFCFSNTYSQTITTNGMSFSPDTLIVDVGDTITFNLGAGHNAVEVDESTYLASGTTSNGGFIFVFGASGDFIADSAKTYYYVCQPHASLGMKGVIVAQLTPVPGCTDSIACNYNPLATVNDGSCAYPTDSTYVVSACDSFTWTNGFTYTTSVIDTVIGINAAGCPETNILHLTINIGGCTDSTANNYDSTATCDNGTCVYLDPPVNLFFSEYAEGSSNNKYFEIYNPTNDTIDLTNYAFARVNNSPTTTGVYEYWVNFDSAAVILPNDVYVVVHPSADSLILIHADMDYGSLSNGDDGFGLVYGTQPTTPVAPGGDYTVLDWIGDWNGDPGQGWSVAGINQATRNHTLIRKCPISQGDTSWTNAAGTSTSNSQWIVKSNEYWNNIGQHTYQTISYDSTSYTICNGLSVTVGSSIYDSSGVYSDTLIAANGCDSVITTTLTVLSSSASIITNNYTICDGDSIIVDSNVYNQTGLYTDTLTNVSGCDSIIITNIIVQTPVFQNITICDGDSIIVGNSVYSADGSYTDTITSSIGCDSIIHTNVTVYSQFNSIFGGMPNNSVGGGSFYSGSQYLEMSCYMSSELVSAVVYAADTVLETFEIRDNSGNVLDDTTVNVIPGGHRVYFNYQMSSGLDYQLGVSGNSNDLFRSNSGVNYPYNFGALSAITSSSAGGQYYYFFYDIEIKQSSQPINYSICDGDSIQVAGSIYSTTGIYVDSLTSSIGCDSLVYTNLIVYPNSSYTNNQTICSGENYTINGNIYDSTGTYFDTLQTQYGCDSLVTTNLIVLTITGSGITITPTMCIGDTMSVGSSIYTTSGTYSDTLTNSSGCDSVITTILTVTSANYVNLNGGILDTASGPGAFSSYNGQLNLDNTIPSLLKSATVYAADTNTVTFELRDNNGNVLQDITHTVYPGSQVLNFDFFIPVGLDFQLGISAGGSGLYRSNLDDGGNWSYPFHIGPVTIHSANTGTTQYYYFYYDLEIMPYATFNEVNICDGDSIQVGWNIYSNPGTYIDTLDNTLLCDSVVYTTLGFYQSPSLLIESVPDPPEICLGDTIILEASSGFSSYSWNNGGSTHFIFDTPIEDTWYLVEAVDSNGCIVREDIWVYVDSCISGINNQKLEYLNIYPNPTTDYIDVVFKLLSPEDIDVRLLNAVGEEVVSESYVNFKGRYQKRFNLIKLPKSVYFIEIVTEKGITNRKIIVQ